MAFAAQLDLARFDGDLGLIIDGPDPYAGLGLSIASAGDVNGDGIDDLIIGSPPGNKAWVVYGNGSGFPASFDVSSLNGANGFTITGLTSNGGSFGYSVDGAGDINNDGYDDLIVGARGAGTQSTGAAWVVFGKAAQDAVVSANTLSGARGFRMSGESGFGNAGYAVASAGDVNADGYDDFLITAPFLNSTAIQAGAVYVVFGKPGVFIPNTNLSALNGTNGFQISGEQQNDFAGWSATSAGDVNNDGFDDVLIGASGINAGGTGNNTGTGGAYLVYGKAGGFTAELLLSSLDGSNGTQFVAPAMAAAGMSVASAGDINADGYDDMVIGAPSQSFYDQTGRTYVVYGKAGGFGANFTLANLIESQGFTIHGETANDGLGTWVSSAGDFNGDGYDDLVIGAPYADISGTNSGAFYLVFGKTGGFTSRIDLATLDGANGFQITPAAGSAGAGSRISAAGDLNNDGFDDLIVGFGANANGLGPLDHPGRAYIIYGGTTFADNVITGTAAGQTSNGATADDDISGLDGNDKLNGLDGDDVLDGGNGADWMMGGAGADTVRGGAGNDYLDGGAGIDILSGGAANDVYIIDQVGDQVIEGIDDGYDVVRASIDYALTANVEALELQGSADLDGTGNLLANKLVGNAGANTLSGGAGADTLLGGDGNDILIGGGEGDRLTGGAGADTFVMTNGSLGGVLETDTILDLIASEGDIIDLSDIDANTGVAGDQAFTVVAAFTKQAGQLTLAYTAAANSTTLRVDINGDGKVDYQVKIAGDVTGDSAGWVL